MAQYANQKTILIHRKNVLNTKHYLAMDPDDISIAAKTLNPVAFYLYLYLSTNKDGYEKDYSPKHFSEMYGVSTDRARKAPEQLVDAGYLVDNGMGKYEFYETPQNKQKIKLPDNTKLVEQEDGTMKQMTYREFVNELKDAITQKEIDDYWNKI